MSEARSQAFYELQERHALQQAGLAGMLRDQDMAGKQQMFLRQSQLITEYHDLISSEEGYDPLSMLLSNPKEVGGSLVTVCDYELEKVVINDTTEALLVPVKSSGLKPERIKIQSDIRDMIMATGKKEDLREMARLTFKKIGWLIRPERDQSPANNPVYITELSILHKIIYRPDYKPLMYFIPMEVSDSLFYNYIMYAVKRNKDDLLKLRMRKVLGFIYDESILDNKVNDFYKFKDQIKEKLNNNKRN